MQIRVAGIVVGLMIASAPALAQVTNPPKPVAAARSNAPSAAAKKPAAHKPASKKTAVATTEAAEPAATPTGTTAHRKAASRAKGEHAPALADNQIPEAERLGIQADLAWLGGDDEVPGGDFDENTVDAIKAFQKRNGAKETGVLTDEQRALLAAAVQTRQEAVGWRVIDDRATGARLGLPGKLVPKSGTARTGSRWTSAQGQIQVESFRLREASLSALFDQEKRSPRGRQIGYSALKPDSFVMSGEQGLKKFVVRVQASGSELRGITILYDQATEGTMDRIANAMANAFQGFPDPNAGPPPGRKRGVEYSTGILVSDRGDLLVIGPATDECQAITVSGLGHAERAAKDKSSDLALLRLYGARNLVPAALIGDSGQGDQLTLAGVADPLAQAGGAAVATANAHVTAQGVDPAPKLGFSGAAATDAQGRFSGVVELKSPIVAGTGVVTQQAALIPAEAVRAFLSAHGIALAAGHAAIDQSIVRVICVRK